MENFSNFVKTRSATTCCTNNAEPISELYFGGLGDADHHKRISVTGIDFSVCLMSVLYSGKWLVGLYSTRNYATSLLFHLAIQGAATEFSMQRQMNRFRGARVIRR